VKPRRRSKANLKRRVASRSARRHAVPKKETNSSANLVQSTKERLGEYGNNVSEEKIQHLAQGVAPDDIQNEEKMRQLIHQVSRSFNVPVDEKTVNDLVRTLRTTDLNQVGALLGNLLR
jgi:uncharacterized protein YpuA (DUF1002 family)